MVRKFKSGKATGVDNVITGLSEALSLYGIHRIEALLNKIHDSGPIPIL